LRLLKIFGKRMDSPQRRRRAERSTPGQSRQPDNDPSGSDGTGTGTDER
jgi:hypothetical protein